MKLSLEKTKAFWLYILGGVVALALGVMLLPVWRDFDKLFFSGWGEFAINIMMSGALIAYILLYLVKRIRRYSGTPAQLVAIVELVLMVVIAVVCTVSTFTDVVSFGEPCQIFGLALWARGVSGVFTGYYCDSSLVSQKMKQSKKNKKNIKDKIEETMQQFDTDEEPRGRVDDFTVWRLTFAVILISVGTFMFITPPIRQIVFQWVFSCAVTFIGLFVTIYGASLKPVRIKVKEASLTESESLEETEQNSSKVSKKNPKRFGGKDGKNATPLLEEGKVKITLNKGESSANGESKDVSVVNSGEEINESAEESDFDSSSENTSTNGSENNRNENEIPPSSTALVVVKKKDKKNKK